MACLARFGMHGSYPTNRPTALDPLLGSSNRAGRVGAYWISEGVQVVKSMGAGGYGWGDFTMYELVTDPFYEIIRKYGRCVIEYCLMKDDAPYREMQSHKEAVLFAMLRAAGRSIENERAAGIRYCKEPADHLCPWSFDMDKAKAAPVDAASFLYAPEILRTDRNGCTFYDCGGKSYPDSEGRIPYWYAFLEPPHGTRYKPDDFRKVNAALFPEGTDGLEVCEWTTGWSGYFDDGHEWWGAACWSVYDARLNRYAVLFASATD